MMRQPARSGDEASPRLLTLRGASFIGIGAMVGAGIFAMFGQAGAVAGSGAWIAFLAAGLIALLQGYSFAKLGARYPSRGGFLQWIMLAFKSDLFCGSVTTLAWLANALMMALVAVGFGSYASNLLLGGVPSQLVVKGLAVALLAVLAVVDALGARVVANVQTAVVMIVLGVLTLFAAVLLLDLDPSLLAPSSYPPMSTVFAAVALTFFAYLGFGIIAFTGGDIRDPAKNLPRAMYISISCVIVLYVGLAIGVFGALPVSEVISSAQIALAVAAVPTLGRWGGVLISIAAVLATVGSLNSVLFATGTASEAMSKVGHLPPRFGYPLRRFPAANQGLVIAVAVTASLAVALDVSMLAAAASTVPLMLFILVTLAHFRLAEETGASRPMLTLTLASSAGALGLFVWFTLRTEPMIFVVLLMTIVLAWAAEAIWLWVRDRHGGVPATG